MKLKEPQLKQSPAFVKSFSRVDFGGFRGETTNDVKNADIISIFEKCLMPIEVQSEHAIGDIVSQLVSCLHEKASALYATLSVSDDVDYHSTKKFFV
jgi:hypothetical protein